MILIGKFTEVQVKAGKDKAACKKAEEESGGKIKYFMPKFRKFRGVQIMEIYGMDLNEYTKSNRW